MTTTDERGGTDGTHGTPPAPELAGFQKRALRALAHGLSPAVQVGDAGPSAGVLGALDAALRDHELVKVRMRQPEDKRALARSLAEATGSALCGIVGHTAILYRPHPERPRLQVPSRPSGARGAG